MSPIRWLGVILSGLVTVCANAAEWQPKQAPLMTRWAKDVTPDKVHPEYPRPQMVRESWVNLNGLWDYAIVADRPAAGAAESQTPPAAWDGKILVPFPVESALSGVMRRVPDNGTLWYRRKFNIPKLHNDGRLLLHFGAVDWQTAIWVNGKPVGMHRGGYDPFTVDITDALIPYQPTDAVDPAGGQELVVAVTDPTDGSFQPRGKQVRQPNGIWYTPTTGIWQTVWLEPVPETHIRGVKLTPHLAEDAVELHLDVAGAGHVPDAQYVFRTAWDRPGSKVDLKFSRSLQAGGTKIDLTPGVKAMWWTPDAPHLIDFTLELVSDGKVLDSIRGYFGMRSVALGRDEHGVNRILLNGQPLFQYGPLDQGFWPDGLYTAPNEAALLYDIEVTKRLGFNMIRKHVKVEPARWYYHCDRLGMLVWQDMPNGDRQAEWDPFGRHDRTETTRSPESSENYNREWRAIIDALRNHPCIVVWVPFNEGWGQAGTVPVTKWTREYDPTRLVNCASGGNDFPVGDIYDIHRYPGPFLPKLQADRAAVLGEFGGLGLPLEGHTWQARDNWGYRSFQTSEELTRAYVAQLAALRPMIAGGMAAAVYTQTTDVEIEVNGLMSYDRSVLKMDEQAITRAARKLFLPAPRLTTLVPTSEETAQTWRFTTGKPADGWQAPDFDDSTWQSGPGGFGESSTPGSAVKTGWKTDDIWLRREFDLKADGRTLGSLHELALRIHHDEDTEVFLNGVLVAKTTGYTTHYIDVPLIGAPRNLLRSGKNTLAVHCHQTGGGQYIDVGLVDVQEVAPPAAK